MFIDKVNIHIKAGNGGNGSVSFRREKYVSHGGPDGGDGGNGGNIVFSVEDGGNTLLDYKYRHKFVAHDGEAGQGRKFHGKNGDDVILKVPRGTVIKHKETGKVIHDMSDGRDFIAAHGGKGGWGNTHFATATRQTPFFAKAGRPGEEYDLTLELKMVADVGLVGYPNVGKSTILSMVSSAKPKIANYQFTTLSPNLGVISMYEKTFIMADIPGLVDGAAEGRGLGHEFLRHVDRCRLLVHVFDISASEREDPLEDIKNINGELKKWSPELAKRPQILVANKIDEGYDEEVLQKIKQYASRKKQPLFLVSAAIGEGLGELLERIAKEVMLLPPPVTYEREYYEEEYKEEPLAITVKGNTYYCTGSALMHLCENVNFDDRESLSFFQRTLRTTGVIDALEKKGIHEGDTVDIYGVEFEFYF